MKRNCCVAAAVCDHSHWLKQKMQSCYFLARLLYRSCIFVFNVITAFSYWHPYSSQSITIKPFSTLHTVAEYVQLRKWNWLCPLCAQSCWLVWLLIGAEWQWLSPELEEMQLLLITDYMIWLWDTNLGGTMTRENSDSSFEEEQISFF